MKESLKREQSRQRQQRKKMINYGIGGGVALIVLGILGFLFWQSVKPEAGEVVAILEGYQTHVEVGTPLSYPTDPPAGGIHYADPLPKGFYDETTLPNLPGDIKGYLVHSLEHGYVIFWYNCAKLDEVGCNTLKAQIMAVMDAKNDFKLIAVPWKSIDKPLVMTSWGRLLRFDTFNESMARSFIENNLNHSPEPDAQ